MILPYLASSGDANFCFLQLTCICKDLPTYSYIVLVYLFKSRLQRIPICVVCSRTLLFPSPPHLPLESSFVLLTTRQTSRPDRQGLHIIFNQKSSGKNVAT